MRQLFLDDSGIELQEGVQRRWHQPVKHGPPVLAPGGPLEQSRVHIWNPPFAAEDGAGWRMWYIGGEGLHPLHALSDDGVEWRRPALGLVKSAEDAAGNLIDLGFTAVSPKEQRLVLCRPDGCAEAAARYCALTRVGSTLKPLTSEDGLRWHYHADRPGIPSDDEYRLGYDPDTGRLIATVKLGGRSGRVRFAVPEYGRSVALSTSTDGLKWTEPQVSFHADHRDREAGAEELQRHVREPELRSPLFVDPAYRWTDVYNMPVFRYEGLYLALPIMFHQCGVWQHPGDRAGSNQDGLLWPCLAWSRDLDEWRRPDVRQPFIPLSPCTDDAVYDNGTIHACAPVRHGDELWFYYYGSRYSHVSPAVLEQAGLMGDDAGPIAAIFLARLRLDGFASLRAADAVGLVLTRPITVDGATLRINAQATGGEIRAEIRDAETGRAIPGFGLGESLHSRTISFPDGSVHSRATGWGARFEDETVADNSVAFSGDAVDAPLTWRGGGDLSALRGRQVRMLFALRSADLYSFGFGDA